VLGVWLGRIYKDGARWPALPWPLALALPVLGVMAVPYLPLGNASGDLLFALVVLPLTMWLAAMARVPQTVAPALDWLGAFSLPLYCVHLTVLVAVSGLGQGWVQQALAVGGAAALAWLFHRFVSFRGKPLEVKPVQAV